MSFNIVSRLPIIPFEPRKYKNKYELKKNVCLIRLQINLKVLYSITENIYIQLTVYT